MLQNQGFKEVSRNGAVPSRKRPWSEVTPNWELTKKIGKTNRYWYKERQWAMWLKFGMDKHKQRKINAYYSGNFREHDEINIVIIGHQWCARSDRRLESYSWPSAPWRPAGLRPHSRASSKKQVLLGNILPNSGHLYVYMSIVFYFPAVAVKVKVTTIPTKKHASVCKNTDGTYQCVIWTSRTWRPNSWVGLGGASYPKDIHGLSRLVWNHFECASSSFGSKAIEPSFNMFFYSARVFLHISPPVN